MQVHYLEIVTNDVDNTCAIYSNLHSVEFKVCEPSLGNARTAELENGGMIGVRAPMHESEEPVIRPYLLVENIEDSIANAEKLGAEIAHPPMALPGFGQFAIFIYGGNQQGLWQV